MFGNVGQLQEMLSNGGRPLPAGQKQKHQRQREYIFESFGAWPKNYIFYSFYVNHMGRIANSIQTWKGEMM